MKVKDKLDLISPLYLLYLIFDGYHFWVLHGIRMKPASIEVEPGKIAAIISEEYSIHIDHRNYEDIKSPMQKIYLTRVPQQF